MTLDDATHVDHLDRKLREVCIPINKDLWSGFCNRHLKRALKAVEERYGSGWKIRITDKNGPVIRVWREGNMTERKARTEDTARKYLHTLGPWTRGKPTSCRCINPGCALEFVIWKGELGSALYKKALLDEPIKCPFYQH